MSFLVLSYKWGTLHLITNRKKHKNQCHERTLNSHCLLWDLLHEPLLSRRDSNTMLRMQINLYVLHPSIFHSLCWSEIALCFGIMLFCTVKICHLYWFNKFWLVSSQAESIGRARRQENSGKSKDRDIVTSICRWSKMRMPSKRKGTRSHG